MFLGDLERKVMTEKGGQFDELEDEDLAEKAKDKTYVQEMEEIKNSFKRQESDEDSEEDDDLLKPKVKSKEEVKKEEEDYKSWLAGQKNEMKDKDVEKDLKGLKEFWSRKDLDEGDRFLRDYILKKRYLNQGDNEDDESEDEEENEKVHLVQMSDDEETLNKMEEFEQKFNFRFEEPDPEFIKRYPRTVKGSLRREDNKRKKKREEIKERKTREKEKRKEELKQLKAIKRREIEHKLEKLKKIAGSQELGFEDDDVDGDFDPDEYDKRMANVFAKYDQVQVENEEEKPTISDLESDLEDDLKVENWDG